jgi:uncharacterized membrane protein YfcA
MTVLPSGSVFLSLLIAPFLAGSLTGITGSGSAIVVQLCFRLFQSLLDLNVGDDEAESSRRILAIASVLSLTQYPVAVWRLFTSKEGNSVRWDAVFYMFPGMNVLVWIGTLIAMTYPPGILLYILGVTLIIIAIYQTIYQTVIGRKIDDEKVRLVYRRHLYLKRQNLLVGQGKGNVNGDDDGVNRLDDQQNGQLRDVELNSTGVNTSGTQLSDLDTLGDVEPKLPKKLKAPNPSFDLWDYSSKNGLNLALAKNSDKFSKLGGENNNNNNNNKNNKNKKKLRHVQFSDSATAATSTGSNTITLHTINENDDTSGLIDEVDSSGYQDNGNNNNNNNNHDDDDDDDDDDDYEMVHYNDEAQKRLQKPILRRIIDDAKNDPKLLLIGLGAGCLAGLLGGMMGINGPPVILFLFYLKLNGSELRDTSILIFFANLPCLLLARIIFNVFHLDEWLLYLIAIITSTLGLMTGSYFHNYCDTRLIMTCLQVVILLSSITLTKPGTSSISGGIFLGLYIAIGLGALGLVAWRVGRTKLIKQQVKQQFYTLHGQEQEER